MKFSLQITHQSDFELTKHPLSDNLSLTDMVIGVPWLFWMIITVL